MICVTINIYGGTPVRSWFTKNNWEIIFPWANFHFLPKLSFTDVCLYYWRRRCKVNSVFLHEKLDLHQIYSMEIWCEEVQTKVK